MEVRKIATIRDVAKKAGVSPATVSRVLNKDANFSILEETRRQVLQAAEELNYSLEESRRTNKKATVILISAVSREGEKTDTYFTFLRNGILDECKRRKIEITKEIFVHEVLDYEEELQAQSGVLTIGTIEEKTMEHIGKLAKHLVIIDDPRSSDSYDAVYINLFQSTKDTLDYLYEKGYRRIGYIGGLEGRRTFYGGDILGDEIRFEAYLQWMKAKQLSEEIHYEVGDWTVKSGYEMGCKMIDSKRLPEAILVSSDPVAIGVYRALKENRISIPKHVAIASFDDVEAAEFLTPALTTVRFPAEELGITAVKVLADRLENGRTLPIRVVLPSTLVARESS